jgi:hypothetical protein
MLKQSFDSTAQHSAKQAALPLTYIHCLQLFECCDDVELDDVKLHKCRRSVKCYYAVRVAAPHNDKYLWDGQVHHHHSKT